MRADASSATLPAVLAERFAAIALRNIAHEYPHKLDHVITADADLGPPRTLHPAFHASYDWHSCVHMHWLLVHVRRQFPDLTNATAIDAVCEAHFAPAAIAGECAYLERPDSAAFERTYGWAWLLKLATELASAPAPLNRWTRQLAPLAAAIEARYLAYLPKADYPIRHGMHANSAFGLLFALDHARACEKPALEALCLAKAREWYLDDHDAPGRWEPSGADFLSPVLVEAALLAHVLDPGAFGAWLDGFLPELPRGKPANLLEPVRVSDRADPQIVHLDGLNLSRAWCMHEIARHLTAGDPRRHLLERAAAAHIAAGLAALDDQVFVGAHWLASFAALALGSARGAPFAFRIRS